MVTTDKAIEIAKKVRGNLDQIVEYESGYVFSSKSDEGYIGGLDHSPVVVLKQDGRLVDMASFMFSGPGKEILRADIGNIGGMTK